MTQRNFSIEHLTLVKRNILKKERHKRSGKKYDATALILGIFFLLGGISLLFTTALTIDPLSWSYLNFESSHSPPIMLQRNALIVWGGLVILPGLLFLYLWHKYYKREKEPLWRNAYV